jgi:hypothetical protein
MECRDCGGESVDRGVSAVSYHECLEALCNEVKSHIDGDDIRVVRAGPGPSGWEDFVWLECGKTRAVVFKLHDRKGASVESQMKILLPNLRRREARRIALEAASEAQRIADKAADDASFVWLYDGQVAA